MSTFMFHCSRTVFILVSPVHHLRCVSCCLTRLRSELTILGVISFGVFIFLQSPAKNQVEGRIILAFEFSHIVIFFAALFFVLEAFFMMLVNQNLKVRIDQSAAMSSTEILEKYEKSNKRNGKLSRWLPSKLEAFMEYKVFNVIFCDKYQLPISAFDFPAYIRNVLDKEVVSLIEVDISSWLFLCVFLILNVIRSMIKKASSDEADGHDGHDHRRMTDAYGAYSYGVNYDQTSRMLGGGGGDAGDVTAVDCAKVKEFLNVADNLVDDAHRFLGASPPAGVSCPGADEIEECSVTIATSDPCADYGKTDGLNSFIISGWLLLLLVIVMAISARRSTIKLLSLVGLHKPGDYAAFITESIKKLKEKEAKVIEEAESANEADNMSESESVDRKPGGIPRRRSNTQEQMQEHLKSMRKSMASGGSVAHHGGHGDHGHGHHHEHDPIKDDEGLQLLKKGMKSTVGALGVGKVLSSATEVASKASTVIKVSAHQEEVKHKYLTPSSKIHPSLDEGLEEGGEEASGHEASPAKVETPSSKVAAANSSGSSSEGTKIGEQPSVTLSKRLRTNLDFTSVYLFGSKMLFTKTLDMALLFNCFYLAVFFSNYSFVALEYDTGGALRFALAILPGVLLYPCVVLCVRTNSMISAISKLDIETVGMVIDETEEMMNMQREVFDVFRNKMQEMSLGPADLKELFIEIDADNSGEIDAKELKMGLHMIGMHFSKNKFKRLFRAVDKDRSGSINYDEFFQLVYPEESDGKGEKDKA